MSKFRIGWLSGAKNDDNSKFPRSLALKVTAQLALTALVEFTRLS